MYLHPAFGSGSSGSHERRMNAPRLGGEKQEAKSNEKMAVGSYVKDKSRMKKKAKTQEAKWHIEDEIKNQKPTT